MKGEIMIQITATVESKEQAKALLEAGVDTLYAGGSVYGLRLPQSFTLEELKELVELTKEYDAKLVVPLNAIMHPEKMSHILSYMENLVEIGVEEVEVGDVGVIHLIRKNELPLKFIYNAQMIVTNARQINFWARKGAVKAVLGREVPYLEMKSLVKASTIPVEVLVYGATCIHQSLRPLVRNYENFIGVQGDTSKEANLFLAEPRKGGTHYSIYEDEHGTHIFADNDLNLMLKLKELYEIGVYDWKLDGIYTPGMDFVRIARCFVEAKEALENGQWDEAQVQQWNETIEKLHPAQRGLDEGFYNYDPDEVK